jgi:Family of unknown function (DUF6804)
MSNAIKPMTNWLPQAVCIVFLILALNPQNPYSYYVFLRWLCFPTFAFLAYRAFERGKTTWCTIFIIAAITYNPLIRVHLPREVWMILNIVTIAVAAISISALRQEKVVEGIPVSYEPFVRHDRVERLRNRLAFIAGVVSFFLLAFSAIVFLNYLGVQTGNGDEEHLYPAVFATAILCAMTAFRIGMAVQMGSFSGDMSAVDRLDYKAWFLGISAWGIFGALLYALVTGEGLLSDALRYSLLAIAAIVIGCSVKVWRDNRKVLIEGSSARQ